MKASILDMSETSAYAARRLKSRKRRYVAFLGFVFAALFPPKAQGQAQPLVSFSGPPLIVNCTLPASPPPPAGVYTSINAALAQVNGPGAVIFVNGPCTEDIQIQGQSNLYLGAPWGDKAAVNGTIYVTGSHSVYLYGLDATSPHQDYTGNGFVVSTSELILDSCTSNGNAASGLTVDELSEVDIVGPASFDNNGQYGYGISVGGGSNLTIFDWAGPTDISNNSGSGVWLSNASIVVAGTTTIANNGGFGLVALSASKVSFGDCFGSNAIQGNQPGGVLAGENSMVSFWTCGVSPEFANLIQGNGPVGISVASGAEVTIGGDTQIIGHAAAGLDLYGGSKLTLGGGAILIQQNGAAGGPRSAAIRVDGNSEALLRGGQISSTVGPAILVLTNSSADFAGVTFSGNSGGIISCDSSAVMVSDLPAMPPGTTCRTPNTLGNRKVVMMRPKIPDYTSLKNRQALYKKLAPKSK